MDFGIRQTEMRILTAIHLPFELGLLEAQSLHLCSGTNRKCCLRDVSQ